jgi:hypothetical protein
MFISGLSKIKHEALLFIRSLLLISCGGQTLSRSMSDWIFNPSLVSIWEGKKTSLLLHVVPEEEGGRANMGWSGDWATMSWTVEHTGPSMGVVRVENEDAGQGSRAAVHI